jgi:membrane protease YdiL (CAAX protease family)
LTIGRATTLFFIVAYAISWAAWSALFALRLSHLAGLGLCLYLLAVFAPHGSAVVVTALEAGRRGLLEFYGLVFRRAPALWIVATIVVPLAIYMVPYAVAAGLRLPHGPLFHPPPRTLPLLILGQSAVVLGEEPGWRGFALPRLTQRLGPIGGTLVLGSAWALWHLPLFMIPGTAQYGAPFMPFLITLIAWSLVVTLIVRRARGSVVVAMLFHASANLCDFAVWEPDPWPMAASWIVASVVAVWLMRREAQAFLVDSSA